MIFNLSDHQSIANHFIAELRDKHVQRDRDKFRNNATRLGQVMAYEISRKLRYQSSTVNTPLGVSATQALAAQPVLITILRAGLPYFQGFLDFFNQADSGFIGAYRREGEAQVVINLDYLSTPSVEGKHVILIDPMLATGRSMVRAVEALLQNGTPAHVHFASLVAVPVGIRYVNEHIKLPHSIWTCAVDEALNDNFYIVPGLGDAGDLSFGEKL